MVFAARKKQLIAIQFKYFGRAYNTEQKSFCECDAGTTQSFLDEHPKPQGLLPVQHVAEQWADF